MKRILAFAAAAVLVGGGVAQALILDSGTVKSADKWRGDYVKTTDAFTGCMTKVLLACEKKGAAADLECDPTCDETTDTGGTLNLGGTGACVAPGHPDVAAQGGTGGKFALGITGCIGKFNPGKKAFDYDASGTINDAGDQPVIGCLGDCSTANGGQLATCSAGDISAEWVTAVTDPAGVVRNTLALFDLQLLLLCGSDPEPVDCANSQAKLLSKLIGGTNKCLAKCQVDFKDKAGNAGGTDDPSGCNESFACAGGPDNGTTCTSVLDGVCGAPGVCHPVGGNNACLDKVIDGVFDDLNPGLGQGLVSTLVSGLQSIKEGQYDLQTGYDTGGSPSVSGTAAPSCGDCGDGTVDFGEECDTGGATGPHANCAGDCDMVNDFLNAQAACICNATP